MRRLGTTPARVFADREGEAAAPDDWQPLPAGSAMEIDARNFPTNRGALCRKGWAAAELLSSPERLTEPLLRRDGKLVPASWDEALEFIGRRVEMLQAEYGKDSVGSFGGGGLTNETAYMLGKFTRVVLASRNIDYNGRFCMASAAVALKRAFGIDRGLPFPLSDLPLASVLLLVGANPAETMPPLMQYVEEQKARGGQLIVIDPRRTPTAEFANLHLQLTPGTDAALANGLLHLLIAHHHIDRSFIESRTTGFPAVARLTRQYWPDRVERITGVTTAKLEEAAALLGSAATVIGLSGRGAEQSSQGVGNVLSFINVLLALGQAGKPGAGFGALTGQGNGQGGREHGQKADQLPGYRSIDDPIARRHVAATWGISPEELPGPGSAACELIDGIGTADGLHGLFVLGSNLLVSAPDANATSRKLRQLKLLVVLDTFRSETAELADVVLPVSHFAEHEGTMTNLEGRLLWRRQAIEAPPGVRTDLEILRLIAKRLGKEQLVSDSPREVFEELGRASTGGPADYSGFSYGRLKAGEQLFWPCPSPGHPGSPRLFERKFSTRDGRAIFSAIDHSDSQEQTDDDYPYYLTTGRLLGHYQTGVQTRRVPSLTKAEPHPYLALHPGLAGILQLREGDWVRIRSRRGELVLPARLTSATRMDVVFVPFHWGGPSSVNLLTSGLVDPESKIPEFKLSAVNLTRIEVPEADVH